MVPILSPAVNLDLVPFGLDVPQATPTPMHDPPIRKDKDTPCPTNG